MATAQSKYDSNLTGTSSAHQPCPNLTSEPTQPCTWMANVIDLHKHPDLANFGPRVGFVLDPLGKGTSVIRGGYGIYYDRIILEAGSEELVQNDRAWPAAARARQHQLLQSIQLL